MQIAYRAVDEHCVKKAIDSLKNSVLKHVNQTIILLDGRTSSEGSYITAGQHSLVHVALDLDLDITRKDVRGVQIITHCHGDGEIVNKYFHSKQ